MDKITDTLKPEFDRFKHECTQIYTEHKHMLENAEKELHQHLLTKFDTALTGGMAKMIGGKDLYDYSSIGEKTITCCICPVHTVPRYSTCARTKVYSVKEYLTLLENFIPLEGKQEFMDRKNHFLNMVPGEKVVIFQAIPVDPFYDGGHYVVHTYMIFCITNFGRILAIKANENRTYDLKYQDHKMWLPVDYIDLLTETLQIVYMTDYVINSKPEVILTMMKKMKDTLYNRKFMPLYVKDVMAENEALKTKFARYIEEKKEFDDYKEKFEQDIKPYINLIETKLELETEAEELKKEKEKLKLVAMKLDLDRKKVEEDMEKLRGLDVGKILG